MNLFLTGGSGNLGTYILRGLLQAGHSLTNYSRTPVEINGVRCKGGDINDPQQLNTAAPGGHDAIIHLAAVPGPGRALSN